MCFYLPSCVFNVCTEYQVLRDLGPGCATITEGLRLGKVDKSEIYFLTVLEGKRCQITLPPPGDRREFLLQPQGTEVKLTKHCPRTSFEGTLMALRRKRSHVNHLSETSLRLC